MEKTGTPNTSANNLKSSSLNIAIKTSCSPPTSMALGTTMITALNNAGRDYQHKDRSRANLFAFLNVPRKQSCLSAEWRLPVI